MFGIRLALMKRKEIVIPFAGSVSVSIECEDGESDEISISHAIEFASEHVNFEKPSSDDVAVEIWELMPHIVRGNVCYVDVREAEVVGVEDVE